MNKTQIQAVLADLAQHIRQLHQIEQAYIVVTFLEQIDEFNKRQLN